MQKKHIKSITWFLLTCFVATNIESVFPEPGDPAALLTQGFHVQYGHTVSRLPVSSLNRFMLIPKVRAGLFAGGVRMVEDDQVEIDAFTSEVITSLQLIDSNIHITTESGQKYVYAAIDPSWGKIILNILFSDKNRNNPELETIFNDYGLVDLTNGNILAELQNPDSLECRKFLNEKQVLFTSLNPFLLDTQLGEMLLDADPMPLALFSFFRSLGRPSLGSITDERDLNEFQHYFTEIIQFNRAYIEDINAYKLNIFPFILALTQHIRDQLSNITSEINLTSNTVNHYIEDSGESCQTNDDKTTWTLKDTDGNIQVSGTPNFFITKLSPDLKSIEDENKDSLDMEYVILKNTSNLFQNNTFMDGIFSKMLDNKQPQTDHLEKQYILLKKFYQDVAFYRWLKAMNKSGKLSDDLLNAFFESLPEPVSGSTPLVNCPECTEEELKEWISCVEESLN